MSEDQRPPRSDVVDVFVFVRVPNVRALAAHNKWRIAAHGAKRPHRRVHASRNHALRALLQARRLLGFACRSGRHQVLSPAEKEDVLQSQPNTIAALAQQEFTRYSSFCNPIATSHSTFNSSSYPSNREGLEDSLGGSGLSFLFLFVILRRRFRPPKDLSELPALGSIPCKPRH